MKISILDLKAQYAIIKKEADAAMRRVVESQNFVLGEEVSALEKEVAGYCGTTYGVGVASGTDALILSLKALGIKDGDEVITSPFTFIASAEAVSLVGARPVFTDIDPRTYNMDPALIEKRITSKTKAIIPVHLYGQCADMDPLKEIAKRHDLKIIEDAAQAIGATHRGRKAGSMGDAGALSFFPSKNLGGYGDGGMIVTNNKELADKIRVLRVHGSSERYFHSEIGTNSRLDAIQAAVLRVKLKYLDGWLEARREKASYYNERLKTLPLILPHVSEYNVHTYHLYVLKIKSDLEKMMCFLTDAGIETRTYYPVPLHLQQCYRFLCYKKGDLPQAEAACDQTFAIPVYPELKKEQMDYVTEKIKEFFRG
ncbi:MAG: DegT/DnrJ/EryC1/StrS family aminotransferase [Candidatus Omnitrophica bacterium]|nr:DegT/DnrJ/EryC1/StrS family aminotransferase [Candidatus Omnitrophota bacterium]